MLLDTYIQRYDRPSPITKVLGRESNLLKRDDISMSMTDEDRIDRGVPAGEGWRTSLMYLLAISREYPHYISKVVLAILLGTWSVNVVTEIMPHR